MEVVVVSAEDVNGDDGQNAPPSLCKEPNVIAEVLVGLVHAVLGSFTPDDERLLSKCN